MRYGNKVRSRLEVATWGKPDRPWKQNYTQTFVGSGAAVVTCDVTAHTKGAYTQIIASTSADIDTIILRCNSSQSSVDTASLVDVAVGASGSESIIIADLAVGGHASYGITIPISIPSGSRLSVRAQSVVTGGKTVTAAISGYSTGTYDRLNTTVDVLGTSTATSIGVPFVSNGTYVEVVSSTSAPYYGIIVVPSVTTTGVGATSPIFALGIGASGSEVDVMSHVLDTGASETIGNAGIPTLGLYGKFVPQGSRLAVKASVSATAMDVCLIGLKA